MLAHQLASLCVLLIIAVITEHRVISLTVDRCRVLLTHIADGWLKSFLLCLIEGEVNDENRQNLRVVENNVVVSEQVGALIVLLYIVVDAVEPEGEFDIFCLSFLAFGNAVRFAHGDFEVENLKDLGFLYLVLIDLYIAGGKQKTLLPKIKPLRANSVEFIIVSKLIGQQPRIQYQ